MLQRTLVAAAEYADADTSAQDGRRRVAQLGYSEEDLAAVPEGANLGLGCGNPQAIAALKPGEVVVDLGAGAGFDCFLAARAVGPKGRGHRRGHDPGDGGKARENARTAGYENVDFRLGEIEHLPVADATADVIISNCVINLSPDKPAVYRGGLPRAEAGRPAGDKRRGGHGRTPAGVAGRYAPALRMHLRRRTLDEVTVMLRDAGFVDIDIHPKEESREFIHDWEPGKKLEDYVLSASIPATKPQ